MEQKTEGESFKIVRNRACIRALLIFLGILVMQVAGAVLCVTGIMLYLALTGHAVTESLAWFADAQNSTRLTICISVVSAMLTILWCGILYGKSSWRVRPFDYKRAFCRKNCLAVLGVGVGTCVVITLLLTGIAALFPQAFSAYNEMMDSLSDTGFFLTVLYVALIGPVSEELIFRGAILDRLYLAFPFFVANTLQAVLFGVYHMNLIQGLYAFVLGFFLGLLRRVTGSIFANIGAHILFNLTSYALSALFSLGFKGAGAFFSIAALLALSVLCAWSVRYLCRTVCQEEMAFQKAEKKRQE